MAGNKYHVSLAAFLKDKDEKVRQAAADALNKASDEIVAQVRNNMSVQGIKVRSGKLRGSVGATKATAKSPRVLIKSEVFVAAPRRPGSRNPRMRNRYKYGVPYGRIIEFSPRINKPFFYTAWYKKRNKVKDDVMDAISKAWSGG